MSKALKEVAEVANVIKEEETTEIIYHKPSSLALLMSRTSEQRFEQGKVFNGFVLDQQERSNINNNEFMQFVKILKDNAADIPPGTRMELVVLASYASPKHWLTVDLAVGENGQISSFVLDGMNIADMDIYDTLRSNFPSGNHYIFKADDVTVGERYVTRFIQTRGKGCDTFAVDHARQLSQIDASILYDQELAVIAKGGVVEPRDFEGGMKLTRIFRGMQTWSGIDSLPEEVRQTVIKESTKKSLGEYISKRTKIIDGKKINETIDKKSKQNKKNRREYFESISPEIRVHIMANRQGYSFLKNPCLFELNKALAGANSVSVREFISTINDLIRNNVSFAQQVGSLIEELEKISSSSKEVGIAPVKNELLATIAATFNEMDERNDDKNKEILSTMIRKSLSYFKESQPDEEKKDTLKVRKIEKAKKDNVEETIAPLIKEEAIPNRDPSSLLSVAISENMSMNAIEAMLNGGAKTNFLFDEDKLILLKKAVNKGSWGVAMHMLLVLPNMPEGYDLNLDKQILKEKFVKFIVLFKNNYPHRSEDLLNFITKIQNKNSALAELFEQPLPLTPLARMGQFSHHENINETMSAIILRELAQEKIITRETVSEQVTPPKKID